MADGIATIRDVAAAAGVSVATVSRVLNGSATVDAERADRVRAAAERLQYTPFSPARALRQRLTDVWAAIVPDVENPFFTSVVRGVEDAATAVGKRLVLCNSDDDVVKERQYVDIALAERMGGVVLASAVTSDESGIRALVQRGVPVVAIDRAPETVRVDTVVTDNHRGAYEATTHLLASGAKRVAMISGPRSVATARERLAGYRDALRDAGAVSDRSLVRSADYREPGGRAAMRSLLSISAQPDAVLVANNLMTLGALDALRSAGRVLRDDMLLVGFDDSTWASVMTPQLTVVAQPTYQMGRTTADLLMSPGEAPRTVVLPPTLIVRESSLPA